MNLYEVVVGTKDDGTAILEQVKAGDLSIESACLIFRRTIGSNDIVMAYKSWNKVQRKAVDV